MKKIEENKPFLKWAGGKNKLINQYQKYFPKEYKTYHEPFLGGGSIFFYINPEKAIISDINEDLINVYIIVKDYLEELIILLKKHKKNHQKEYYYKIRSTKYEDKIQRAARFIYLNKTYFNGLYRENKNGEFNVPIGNYKDPNICAEELLRKCSNILNNKDITIKCQRFNECKKDIGDKDFVYFDPPYFPLNKTSNFTSYTKDKFGIKSQELLYELCNYLKERKVKVMLSNSNTEYIKNMYKDYNITEIKVNRTINSKTTGRTQITELLITSY
ncbi:DNA adenine methylase [Arthrospira platensis SPKY2]